MSAAAALVATGFVNLASCDRDCSSIGYSDGASITLPVSMLDGHTALRMCVDDQCNDEGELKGLPAVGLSGSTLTLALDPNPAGPATSIVRLVATGAVAVDTSLRATWRVDHHGGCADSRYIDLRFDAATNKLTAL